MAGADMSGPHLEELAQREELVKEREEAADQREEGMGIPEEAAEKREEELSMREQAHEKADKQTEPIRASAAGSSSPPRQLPSPRPATDIHDLPDEVLAKIFALFNLHMILKVLSVCRHWRGVIQDWYLNKELKFEGGTFTTEDALSLIHSAPGLKSLQLYKRSDTLALLDAAFARCTKLLHLSVDSCNESSSLTEALGKVFKANPRITDLRLIYISGSEDLRFYQDLGAVLPDLRKLDLNIDSLSSLQLDALLNSCAHNQMEEFKASSNPCSEEHIAKLVQAWGRSLRVLELNAIKLTEGALALLAGCSELRRLELAWLTDRGSGLCCLATLPHLEELWVSFRTRVNNENLCRFFSQSRSRYILRKLTLHGWIEVDNSSLASVAASCPELEELQVTGRHMTNWSPRGAAASCAT